MKKGPQGPWALRPEARHLPPLPARPNKYMQRGTLDLLLLKLVAVEPGCGIDYHQRLRELSDGLLEPTNSALYPSLREFERRGWVGTFLGMTPHRRVARFYWVNPSGKAALGEEIARWRRCTAVVERILSYRS